MPGYGGIVGRAVELDLLSQKLVAARSGRGAVVFLGGEPGIGKTTLAAELVEVALHSGMIAAWGRCREAGDSPPYRPWAQVLRVVLKDGVTGLAGADLDPYLGTMLEPPRGVNAPGPDGSDRFRLFEAMASVLAQAGQRGLLAVIDDLHRADDASLAFLRYLVAELHQLPIVVLGAYRDNEVGREHPLMATIGAMAEAGALEVLSLRGLADVDVLKLVGRHAGALPEVVGKQVVARAEGNPFFAVEIARLLRSAPGDATELAVSALPPTVREVITHRLNRLPPESQAPLRVAAVLGRDFGQLPLSAALGASPLAVTAALQPAASAGLICASGAAGYSFVHALIQEVIYDALPASERAHIHRGAAKALASLERDDDETLGAVAYHGYRASLDGDSRPALAQVLAAGRRARQRLAFVEAAQWMARALELAERAGLPSQEYVELLCEAADTEVDAGAASTARAHYEGAADLARGRLDSQALARAALGVGSTVVTAGKVDWELVRLLEEAEQLTEDQIMQARLQSRRAIELYWYAGSRPSRQQSLVALQTAEASEDDEALGVALYARQFTLRGPDHLHERVAIGERLMALADSAGNAGLSFQSAVWLAADVMRTGDLPRFRTLTESLGALAAQAHRPLWRWYSTVMAAQLAAVEGRVDDAYAATEAAGALGRQLDVEVALAYRVGQLCVLDRERRGLASLLDDITEARMRMPYFVTIRAFLALAAATSGRAADAKAEIDRLSGHGFAVVPRDSLWVATIALLLESAAISGSVHTATLVELLVPHRGTFVVQGLPNCWGSVDRFLGRGLLALGELQRAERALSEALGRELDLAAPLFVARTKLDQARLARARGRGREAVELASEVEASAERLRLDALADEAHRVSGGPRTPADVLSAREKEVLALLGAGASNKDIAATLVISLNTAERHVANIYTKLGARGRAEAAVVAVRAGLVQGTGNGGFP